MSYQNGPQIATSGLIAYLDPGHRSTSPASMTDLTNNNCNGILMNNAILSYNNNGTIILDGTNDYINFPNNSILNNAITIDIWTYVNSVNNSVLIYAGADSYNSAAWDWSIYLYGGNMLCRGNAGAGGTNIGSLSSIYLGKWNNIILDRTGFVYLNGSYLTTTISGSGSSQSLRIGKSGTAYFNGRIGPTKIYNRSLSSNEILQNYNALKGRFQL